MLTMLHLFVGAALAIALSLGLAHGPSHNVTPQSCLVNDPSCIYSGGGPVG